MNILVIPSWYPSGADKLMGIYHKEFCEALAKRDNINVNMLYLDRQCLSTPFKYLFMKKKETIKEKGYNTYLYKLLDLQKISFDTAMKHYTNILEKSFKDYLKTNPKPDIIQAMVTLPAGFAACKLGEKYHIPVVVTEHASYYKNFFAGKNKKYGDYVLENATFTTVSEFMAKYIRSFGKSCTVIPNLVNTEIFKGKKEKTKDLKLIIISALRKGKSIDTAIEALKILIMEEKIKGTLTVVGDGPEKFYQHKCHELGMDDYVNFVGRKTKEEIVKLLKQHNILVITSEFETFGIPGIEALASGLPVISTKCFGPEEYIDNKCGKLVAKGNAKEMSKAILEVYQNIDNYDIKYLQSIADQYNEKSITDKVIKLYQSILKK